MTTVSRRVLAGLLGIVGLLAIVYVADVAMASGRVPRGTEVSGVEIGGKTRAEALRLIAARVPAPKTVTVTVPGGPKPLVLDAAAVGLRIDPERTVDLARNEALNPFSRLAGMFATHTVEPASSVDDAKLRAAITKWARTVDRGRREGYVRFDGTTPVAVPPRDGLVLDVDATAAAVVDAFPDETEAEGVVEVDKPKTTAESVAKAVSDIASPAVAAPVSLTTGGRSVTLTPAHVVTFLKVTADADGTITPKLDEKKLDEVMTPVLRPVEQPAKDAPVKIDEKTGKLTVGKSEKGTKVDRDALAAALLPVLAQPAPRSIALEVTESEPRLSTAKAKTLGIKEKVGEFTTYHPCCRPRVKNIHIMADIVEGAVVLPGETFSLNGHVGPRDRARGFVDAPMILNGKFVDAVGGGVSQFATTMFNAVFFGGFEDVQHKPHSYYISRYPPGREATVSSPEPDLRWRNDSKYGVLITTSYTEKSITVTFWSTKRYEIESITGPRYRHRSFGTEYDYSPTCQSTSGVPGFDIDVWRVFKIGGKEVRREKFHTRYLPEPRFVCR
ncbi:MAG TPA: VanW family protein [Frankiaceae bacterium]|nr:VanW family protein [Frankiaceae bacterium]